MLLNDTLSLDKSWLSSTEAAVRWFVKRRLLHRCFPAHFTKSSWTPLLQNTSGQLLLHQKIHSTFAKADDAGCIYDSSNSSNYVNRTVQKVLFINKYDLQSTENENENNNDDNNNNNKNNSNNKHFTGTFFYKQLGSGRTQSSKLVIFSRFSRLRVA